MITSHFKSAALFRPAALLALATLVLAACGPTSASAPTKGAAAGGGEAGAAPGAGGEAGGGGGEAAGLSYQNARFHYRVDAPGPMLEAADGSASTKPGEERMSVSVVTGASAADLRALAESDLKQLQATSPKYHLLQPLGAITITGHASLKAVYSWTDGTNAITGRPADLVTARFYIPKDASKAAVLAYSIAASQYDPQGANDVASTFAWL